MRVSKHMAQSYFGRGSGSGKVWIAGRRKDGGICKLYADCSLSISVTKNYEPRHAGDSVTCGLVSHCRM